ncbi:nucleotidyltransferase domain-containing protein [Priestia endophytica]|uniref:nucleotidyltransferase domain-containing protein n=1 Tax=Priestia endophytica TaxID=135735 RepID=UPI0020410251|nr:nucleotidyltransferase family protein [Priestia endophytica]MCM3539081.1 nucleotidyltransferase family protein [Priestia endophytica]
MERNGELDLSLLPRELKAMLNILNYREGSIVLEQNMDWNYFLQLVKHHRIYPLVYAKLRELRDPAVPPFVIEMLTREYQKNTFSMLHLSAEMERVSKLFSEQNIKLLFLKGPPIAHDIYGDISLRTSKDLDVLIQFEDVEKAEDVLIGLGYEREDRFFSLVNEWKWLHHHIIYFHPQKKIQVEIHWRSQPFPMHQPTFNELWERRRKSELTSSPVYLLGEEDLFIFLIAHGTRHGWFRLRWLADVDYMMRRKQPFKKVEQLRSRKQFNLVGQALLVSAAFFETPIPEEAKNIMEEKRAKKLAKLAVPCMMEMSQHYIQMEIEREESHKGSIIFLLLSKLLNLKNIIFQHSYLYEIRTVSQRLLQILRFVYPKPHEEDQLKLPKVLKILYFPLRPYLWMKRKSASLGKEKSKQFENV